MPWKKPLLQKLLIPAILFCIVAFKLADDDFTALISSKMMEYRTRMPQEKAYLHLDKPYYSVGDTLWFKAYLAEASLHQADSANNLLYVDLVEQRTGKHVALRHVQMRGGTGYGDIVLADTLAPGAYTVRAYTSWMRNFADDFFFKKDVFLFDETGNVAPSAATKVDIGFFPEGGELVAGIRTRIAFKALNERGIGENAAGFVLNKNKDTVAFFKSEHLGMGRFQFEPLSGETYSAYLKNAQGQVTPYPFPPVRETGYTMIVDNLSNPTRMRILAYCKNAGSGDMPVNIVGHARGIIAFVAKGKISDKGLMMSLPTTDLPDGITHLTLFDGQNKPVSERLVFINHERSLKIKLTPGNTAYKPREETEIEVTVTDSAGKPVEASLSVAVTDAGQILQQNYDADIVSYLLLSSDLKGFVEQPGYYFDTQKSERKIHLDYLMMTQGWSRFRWQDVFADSLPAPQRFLEQGVTLEGEVKRNNKNITEKIMLSVYLSNDSLSSFMTTETDETGKFAVYNLAFSDSLKIRLQGMNKKGNQNLSFLLHPFEPPKATLRKIPYVPVTVDARRLQEFLERAAQEQELTRRIRENRERLLQEVTIKGKKQVQRDSRKLYSNADASLKVTTQMASGNRSVLDMLAGRVAGVQVVGSGMNASVFIRGNRGEPLFVLDGMPVDKAMITSLNVFDVESIDVLKGASAAIFGSRGGSGVISVLTKRGNENYDYSQDVVPGVLVSKIAGFHTPREFYAPKYGLNTAVSAVPDFRSTIYWAPMLKTDGNGKAYLRYYNTDAVTSVAVQAEVLSPSGMPGSGKMTYKVE